MAFVTELLPAKEKEKFKFPCSKYNGFLIGKEKWSIDREKNIFLFRVEIKGGGYEGTPEEEHYILSLNNEIIKFIAFPEWIGVNGKKIWKWSIIGINNKSEEVKNIIVDALISFAYSFGHPDKIASVDVVFEK